jgi:hypothetical protein
VARHMTLFDFPRNGAGVSGDLSFRMGICVGRKRRGWVVVELVVGVARLQVLNGDDR